MDIIRFSKFAIVFCVFTSCVSENKLEKEITKIPVEVKIERFDQLFAKVTEETLPELKEGFPFLFPKQYSDSTWIKRANDTLQIEINREVKKTFPDLLSEEEDLRSLLQHIKYYFPEVTVPRAIAITSDVDYRNKIVLSGNLLIISLDTYLGEDHYFYEGIQAYLKRNFKKSQIMPDIATMYAKQLVELPKNRTFLANLIYYGKEMYLKKIFLPNQSDAEKMGYSDEQYAWLEANEEQIWRYFIDRQLLYSTGNNLMPRFLYPAPFSKFYLEEIDKEAPDRVGQYIGWRIVASYMKNNNVSLRQLLMADAETIFNTSKYKPAR
ncbi:gliding motility lipoprotein GldB [Aquimarina sp. MMG016]|uniref:gliding motility lipoprotein GldB n=1 Tax=Aquimarina sp. MMG016 TaxID=2822690 RepID=UPI001B3A5A6A|nr:gliding motility lipoprotein GldB [Aquimarina sp. MMG016]MBQ4818440.1 gliding motility lipoprotein GldB [Aquimarina sp. MMG016]